MAPLGTDSPIRHKPWMNWLIIVANIAAMIWQTRRLEVLPRYQLDLYSLDLLHFLSYAFLHLGWMHLGFNMLVLFILGNNVNDRLGHLGYLAFYLGGAVFSAVGFLALGGKAMVGASGAVGAVMGAFVVLMPSSNINVHAIIARLEVPSLYFVVVFFIYNVIMSVLSRLSVQTVAYEAHIAGMVFGFVVILGLLLARLIPRHPADFIGLVQRWGRRRKHQRPSERASD